MGLFISVKNKEKYICTSNINFVSCEVRVRVRVSVRNIINKIHPTFHLLDYQSGSCKQSFLMFFCFKSFPRT